MTDCFVVGNAPQILQWDLTSLHSPSLCVIGVNRAHMVLPGPTAFFFIDACLDTECHDAWLHSGALVVGPGMYSDIDYVRPKIVCGDGGWAHPLNAHTVYVDGNSGVAAARWALSLGLGPVWILGVSTTVQAGDSDFAGAIFGAATASSLERQANQLLRHHGDQVRVVSTQAELYAAINQASRHSQPALRQWIREQTKVH